MRFIDLFARDHPDMDPERAVIENCPSDFGYQHDELCVSRRGDPAPAGCPACWEQEVPEE